MKNNHIPRTCRNHHRHLSHRRSNRVPLALRANERAHHAPDMTPVKPESVGFSAERLDNLHALIQGEIDQKQLSGAVTILARHGKIVDYRTYGQRDIAANAPMTKDTIFRDYSMTKPVTGVAMMILYEQGKWLPSDPISKFIPQFAHLKVFTGVDATGQAGPRRSRSRADDARAHDPLRRLLLRQRPHRRRRHVQRSESDAVRQPAGDGRQARHHPAQLPARQRLDLQRLDGHRGIHRRKALRPIAPRLRP